LQQVNVQSKLQKSKDKGKTAVGAILQQGLATVKQTAKILGSTVAQVPVNGTGTHFVYAFRTDTYLQPAGGNQRSAFAQFFGAGGIEGAQYALRGETVPGEHKTEFFADTRSDSIYSYGADVREGYNEVPDYKQPDSSALDREPNPLFFCDIIILGYVVPLLNNIGTASWIFKIILKTFSRLLLVLNIIVCVYERDWV